jgi:hypothetical protein
MLQAVIVVGECAPGVVRRINANALDLSRELLFQRFQCQEVVTVDQAVFIEVRIRDPARCVVTLGRVFEQYSRLEFGSLVLADPREFQLGVVVH